MRAGARPVTAGMTAGVGVGCGHCIGILQVETLGGVWYICGQRRRSQNLCQGFWNQ